MKPYKFYPYLGWPPERSSSHEDYVRLLSASMPETLTGSAHVTYPGPSSSNMARDYDYDVGSHNLAIYARAPDFYPAVAFVETMITDYCWSSSLAIRTSSTSRASQYIGQNAFGATSKVTSFSSTGIGVVFVNTSVGDEKRVWTFHRTLDAEAAKALLSDATFVYVGRPALIPGGSLLFKAAASHTATLSDPTDAVSATTFVSATLDRIELWSHGKLIDSASASDMGLAHSANIKQRSDRCDELVGPSSVESLEHDFGSRELQILSGGSDKDRADAVQMRLKQLDQWLFDGTISKDEYASRRAHLLSLSPSKVQAKT